MTSTYKFDLISLNTFFTAISSWILQSFAMLKWLIFQTKWKMTTHETSGCRKGAGVAKTETESWSPNIELKMVCGR
jgi:hypothetical protein